MTTALQKVEALLPDMSPSEKAQVAKWVSDDLSCRFPGIEKTPGVCGGSACIVRTRIPVWLLVEARQAGASEADLLKSYPSLRAEDLTNAWAYYRANKAEIEQEILENEAVEAA
ncbi:MAG: DUF433 domain-containing protein [Saprospiraceae bacterium]|nr:DUF433 domain-containing protein [Saprospiraceae bacterium]